MDFGFLQPQTPNINYLRHIYEHILHKENKYVGIHNTIFPYFTLIFWILKYPIYFIIYALFGCMWCYCITFYVRNTEKPCAMNCDKLWWCIWSIDLSLSWSGTIGLWAFFNRRTGSGAIGSERVKMTRQKLTSLALSFNKFSLVTSWPGKWTMQRP